MPSIPNNLSKAERSINRLIESRAADRERTQAEVAAWEASCEKYRANAEAERRREWIDHHLDLCALHSRLADEHADAARRLQTGHLVNQTASGGTP